jgi:hypothetical protein
MQVQLSQPAIENKYRTLFRNDLSMLQALLLSIKPTLLHATQTAMKEEGRDCEDGEQITCVSQESSSFLKKRTIVLLKAAPTYPTALLGSCKKRICPGPRVQE